jgi:hypothetical protein
MEAGDGSQNTGESWTGVKSRLNHSLREAVPLDSQELTRGAGTVQPKPRAVEVIIRIFPSTPQHNKSAMTGIVHFNDGSSVVKYKCKREQEVRKVSEFVRTNGPKPACGLLRFIVQERIWTEAARLEVSEMLRGILEDVHANESYALMAEIDYPGVDQGAAKEKEEAEARGVILGIFTEKAEQSRSGEWTVECSRDLGIWGFGEDLRTVHFPKDL